MTLTRFRNCAAGFLAFAALTAAYTGLSTDDMNLLQDPGGWEYISLSDAGNGIQTVHTCFDGAPHPNECSGTLALNPNDTFVQNVHIQGQTVQRHGTYQIDGNQITFVDELDEKDGPYTIDLNSKAKSLVLTMAKLRIELQLEKEYKSHRDKPKT